MEHELRSLPPQARTVWHLANAAVGLGAVIALAVLLATGVFGGANRWAVGGCGVLLAATALEALVLIPRRFRYTKFSIDPVQLYSVRGALWVRRRTQPWRHVLFVEAQQGPFLRMFGLFRVRIGTIADGHFEGPFTADVVQELQHAARGKDG